MAIEIGEYSSSDFAGVAALWNEAFPGDAPRNAAENAIPQKLRFQRDLFLVARSDGKVVGSVMAGYDGHRGWISRVAVCQSFRMKGVARDLIQNVEQRLRAIGCPKINLQVVTSNAAVVPFYERIGYVVEPRISMGKLLT